VNSIAAQPERYARKTSSGCGMNAGERSMCAKGVFVFRGFSAQKACLFFAVFLDSSLPERPADSRGASVKPAMQRAAQLSPAHLVPAEVAGSAANSSPATRCARALFSPLSSFFVFANGRQPNRLGCSTGVALFFSRPGSAEN
jgi:hypothetical protein